MSKKIDEEELFSENLPQNNKSLGGIFFNLDLTLLLLIIRN
jgi:hypothetical protein